jgi:hypothetical protein
MLVQDVYRSVRIELGLQDNSSVDRQILEKLNEAVKFIHRKGAYRFPWLRKNYILDVIPANTVVVNCTLGSRQVTITSGNVEVRGVLYIDSISYVIASISGNTVQLSSQFVGSTGEHICQHWKAYYELPDNLAAVEQSVDIRDLYDNSIKPISLLQLATMKKEAVIVATDKHYYTVVGDPINLRPNNQFLHIWPYYTEYNSLNTEMFFASDELVDNSDVIPVPEINSDSVLKTTLWFFCVARKYEESVVAQYRMIALSILEDMLKAPSFMEHTEGLSVGLTEGIRVDLSGINDFVQEGFADFIPG